MARRLIVRSQFVPDIQPDGMGWMPRVNAYDLLASAQIEDLGTGWVRTRVDCSPSIALQIEADALIVVESNDYQPDSDVGVTAASSEPTPAPGV